MDTVGTRYGAQKPKMHIPVQPEASEETPEVPEKLEIPEIPVQKTRQTSIPQPKEKKPRTKRKPLVIAVALIVFLVLSIGACTVIAQSLRKIPEGVTAAGVELGGMTKSQAVKALGAVKDNYFNGEMVVTLPDGVWKFTSKETGASLKINELAADARKQSAGAQMDLQPYLSLNEETLRSALTAYAQRAAQKFVPSGYVLEGAVPALGEKNVNESVPCPKLILTVGNPSFLMDTDKLYDMIQQAYLDGSFVVDAQSAVTPQQPEKLDLEKVRQELCIAPVDASLDPATHQPVPGSYGIDFDLETVQNQLGKAKSGDQLEIPLRYQAPKVMGQEAYFKDVLGFCQTPHSDNEKRNNNLELACATLNGIVLQPGDTISYNDTLGKRTTENGYQSAPAYSGTDLVDNIGGGICQVSSTLYLCSLYAELETVERINHGFPVSYIPYGLDATVNWGSPDLKIRNDSDYPVKIVAEVTEGFVRIWIMGTETRDYYVRMGYSSGGNYARSFVCKYDRTTDEQISRDEHRLSGYLEPILSVKGEIGMDEAYINTNIRKQDPCEPTPEILEESKNYKKPNQHAEQ